MIRISFVICALLTSATVATGCGNESADDTGGPSLAEYAQPGSLVFIESRMRLTGAAKADANSLAQRIAGVDSIGELVAEALAKREGDRGEPIDFDSEVEPWLGERAAAVFVRFVDGELSKPLIVVQITDPAAARAFVSERTSSDDSKRALGVVDDVLVAAASQREFKAAVDASTDDSLADEDRFQEAIAAASNAGIADAYIDVGGFLRQSGDRIDSQAREVLRGASLDLDEATAVASLIPRSEQIEIDVSSDLGGREAPDGDVSKLLGSLPADSFAAVGFSDFGEQVEEAVDDLDESGIPGSLEPGELKSMFAQAGINLDKIAGSLENGAAFAAGNDADTLGGALVLTGKSGEAADAIAALGTLLRGANVPGITAVGGSASGFSVRGRELGGKPIVVLGKGNRVSIGYGHGPAFEGIAGNSGPTLAGTAGFKAASNALGKTPISGYVDGPAALRLVEALVPRSSEEFWNAVPYLRKIDYVGIATSSEDGIATAKLIAGLQ